MDRNVETMALPANLQSTDPGLRLELIRMAVLKIMDMNNTLYCHLYSNTFDVPHYEKENILYNNETLDMQVDDYMSGGYYHTDFRFHQKLLDVQIISNRRIRQNVRECREMYADRHNPLYSRKKYKTIEIFPDAVKRNLPELLPMTHLCDHLLTVCHYMHDPVVSLVMDYITDGATRPSVVPGIQSSQSSRGSVVFPGSFNTKSSSMIPLETRANTVSVEISRSTATPASARHVRALEFPGHVLPVEIPQPVNSYQRNGYDISKPVNLLEKSRHPVPVPDRKSEKSKPVEEKKPVKPIEKPKILCASDMVGQILMQGLNNGETQFTPLIPHGRPDKTMTKSFKCTETIKKPILASTDKTLTSQKGSSKDDLDSRPVVPRTATKPNLPITKVAWDTSKVLDSKPGLSKKVLRPNGSTAATATVFKKQAMSEKRSSENVAEHVRDEMAAKRQRMSQWLLQLATQPTKKADSGTKRKASLMDKSCKDLSAKKQKLTEAQPRMVTSKTPKKTELKWIKW